jgi:hypothetical protein
MVSAGPKILCRTKKPQCKHCKNTPAKDLSDDACSLAKTSTLVVSKVIFSATTIQKNTILIVADQKDFFLPISASEIDSVILYICNCFKTAFRCFHMYPWNCMTEICCNSRNMFSFLLCVWSVILFIIFKNRVLIRSHAWFRIFVDPAKSVWFFRIRIRNMHCLYF